MPGTRDAISVATKVQRAQGLSGGERGAAGCKHHSEAEKKTKQYDSHAGHELPAFLRRMCTELVHVLPPRSFGRRRSGSSVHLAEQRDANHARPGAPHRFGTIGECCHSHKKDIYRHRHPGCLAGLQGVSRTRVDTCGAKRIQQCRLRAWHGTGRHPRAQGKDPRCHRLGRQSGGKLREEALQGRELAGLFGTPAV